MGATGERSGLEGLIVVYGAGSGFTLGRSDGEVSCTFPDGCRGSAGAPAATGRSRASAAEATAARSAAGVPSTRRGSRGSVTVNLRPIADAALDLDRAAVHVHDRADDREPEPAPAAARLVRPRAAVEALEDVRQLGRLDADARVGHLDPRPVRRRRHVDRDRAAARRELDRVGDEVGDDLADALRVVADPDRRDGEMQLDGDAAPLCRGRALLDGRLDGRPQVVRPQVEQDQPRIELRELEQVLGQPVEPLDLLAARLEELGACRRDRRRRPP